MIRRIEPGPRMSQAVIHGSTVYLAGQVAQNPAKGVADQTRQVLAAVDRLLASVGSDKTRILSANVYLADIQEFGEMNSVWDEWVSRDCPPARATIEARLASPAYRVEVQVIAACD